MHQLTLFNVTPEPNQLYRSLLPLSRKWRMRPGTRIRILSVDECGNTGQYRILYALANDPYGYHNGVGEMYSNRFPQAFERIDRLA